MIGLILDYIALRREIAALRRELRETPPCTTSAPTHAPVNARPPSNRRC